MARLTTQKRTRAAARKKSAPRRAPATSIAKRKPAAAARLRRYRAMRDFAQTPEPSGKLVESETGDARFVIQEHHASHLHWDFRLERAGVLVSWALPKGLPQDPKKNHLAVHTEDHPLSYIDFAGDIPPGNYGAGHVEVWDSGRYDCHKFRDDEVIVTLHGRVARGKYVLFQTNGKNWMIHRMDPPPAGFTPMPRELTPMLAQLADLPADDAHYAYEIKWDGIRALVYIDGGRIRIVSRNGNDVTAQYPELKPLGAALGARGAILDGEIVALDENGRPSFQLLQGRMGRRGGRTRVPAGAPPIAFMIFDLLYFDGRLLTAQPYRERRAQLDRLKLNGPHWQTPSFHVGDGVAMLRASLEQHLEGIVAKRVDSIYEPGRRPGTWLKIKNQQRQEFVIGGYTKGERHAIGSLLLGYYAQNADEATPQLLFAGGVGTGFTQKMLDELLRRLAPLKQRGNPFNVKPAKPGVTFVKPELVAEIEFTEWTHGGTLRHPSFKGLRFDKAPTEVVRERSAPAASRSAALTRGVKVSRRTRAK